MSQNEKKLISVLIVEDGPIAAVMVTEALKGCYDICHVTSGEEAIVHCVSPNPDIILLDVQMPGVSGLEVCISLKLSIRQSTPIGWLMINVDHFKEYNDEYGHLMGDKCLKLLALTLSNVITRPNDCLARYGGGEFVVVMPSPDKYGVEHIARKMLSTVQQLNIGHEKSPKKLVSINISGVTANTPCDSQQLISQADQNLYKAKSSGRDQVFLGFGT